MLYQAVWEKPNWLATRYAVDEHPVDLINKARNAGPKDDSNTEPNETNIALSHESAYQDNCDRKIKHDR